MKKKYLLLLLFVFLLCGCNNEDRVSLKQARMNQKYFNLLNGELKEYGQKIDDSGYLTMNLSINLKGVYTSDIRTYNTIREISDPLYLEVGKGLEKDILFLENDKIIHYALDVSGNYFRKDEGPISEYGVLFQEENSEEFLKLNFNKRKCTISYENDEYIIRCRFENALNDVSKSIIEELYESLDFPFNILYDSLLEMRYKFNDKKMYMSFKVKMSHIALKNSIIMTLSLALDYSEFTPVDVKSEKYKVEAAGSFEEATETYDINEINGFYCRDKSYLKVEAKKGMLVCNNNGFKMELYDLDQNMVSESLAGSRVPSNPSLNKLLPIEEDGTYYLYIENISTIYDVFDFDFYEYDTIVSSKTFDLATVSSNKGTIEGKYDLVKYKYTNNNLKNHSVRIQNIGTEEVYIYTNLYGADRIMSIKPNQIEYLSLPNGETEFYICHNFKTSKELSEYEYQLHFKVLHFEASDPIYECNIPNKIELTRSDALYYYTDFKKGVYNLSADGSNPDVMLKIYDNFGNLINVNVADYYVMREFNTLFSIPKDGKYYLYISNSNKPCTCTLERYDYDTIPDKDNPLVVNFNQVPNIGVLEGKYDFEYYNLVNDSDVVKIYRIINDAEYDLGIILKEYPNQNKPNFLIIKPNDDLYISCKPGNAEILIARDPRTAEDVKLEYNFRVVEVESNIVTDINSPDIKEITTEYSDQYYLFGYGLPTAYFKIVITEPSKIKIIGNSLGTDYDTDYMYMINYYDLSGNLIYGEYLDVGEYYVGIHGTNDILYNIRLRYIVASDEE